MEERNHLFQGFNQNKKPWNNILERFRDFKSKNEIDNTYFKNIKLKKALTVFMVFTIIGLAFIGYKANEIKTRAFDIYIGDDKIGAVKSEEEALKIIKELKSDISKEYSANAVIDKDIRFEATHAKESQILTKGQLKEKVKSKAGFLVAGYALKVNGEEVGVLKSSKDAQYIIDKIKEPYLKDTNKNAKIKEVKFLEDIEIVKKDVPLEEINKQEELIKYIMTGSEEVKTHVVEVGESFWTIAKIYNMPVEDLERANSDMNPTKLKPGDEVKLVVPTSKLTVSTVEEVEYTENINYEVEVQLDDSMYKNQKKVKVEGVNGESKIVANEIKHNGILVEKEIINEEIIKAPVNEVVVQGTKEVPKTVATGTFLMPTRGRISSGYGRRWGRMHKGIDIAASPGTPIKAADGGTVSFAGYQGSYGYMVEINHGNGYKTRYAHCSKLHVKVGQKVAKGQHIANVGNTGRSTGPHLHLEVLKNGVHQNPSKYVK